MPVESYQLCYSDVWKPDLYQHMQKAGPKMKLLYIADGRSPIAVNWIGYFIKAGNEVHLVSTFPCPPLPGLASLTVIPVGLSSVYGQVRSNGGVRGHFLRQIIPVGLRTRVRQLLAPLTFQRASSTLREVIQRTQPHLIHAMRIPFEGMVAAMALGLNPGPGTDGSHIPFLISVWGNDFTLHARSSSTMAHIPPGIERLTTHGYTGIESAGIGFASTSGIVLRWGRGKAGYLLSTICYHQGGWISGKNYKSSRFQGLRA
jgi:hypothetical protein